MEITKLDKRTLLSALWLFVTLNYAYCDIFTLFHSEDLKNFIAGKVGNMIIDQNFLLTFSIVMEIPIIMILLSKILSYKANRISNIIAGCLMTIVQLGSLFSDGVPTKHYFFFSAIEITGTILIAVIAFTWKKQNPSTLVE